MNKTRRILKFNFSGTKLQITAAFLFGPVQG